ncbi:MAG TPA: VWA domain-containing protein, partial [bacterium]|nr:VWA domain-containing protein [bacterium]
MTMPEAPDLEQAQQVPYSPQLVRARTDIDIIIDASGSMAAIYSTTNKRKLDLVREALYDIIFGMGQQQTDYPVNLGVRAFGSDSPASDANSQDSRQIVPMGAPDLAGIRSLLDPLTAQGLSPVAYALAQAMTDFPAGSTADRVIVLVADGADNTNGDPCETVSQVINAGPVKTTIHVVAYDVAPADMEQLECIARRGDGQFFLARNEGELRAALDQAINSTIPYSLKLTAQAGATPIPFTLSVLRAGSEQVIRREKSFGTKLLRLDPGSYDLLIEYSDSPEVKKPSKVIKGVQILATTKVEQTIAFDLGQVTLLAVGGDGTPAPARFQIFKDGAAGVAAEIESLAGPATFFLTPGTYDITAELLEGQIEGFSLSEKGIEVASGQATDKTFLFQKGAITLRAVTTQREPSPFVFHIYRADRPDQLIASGAAPIEGGQFFFAPGLYDIIVMGADSRMPVSPRTKISGVDVQAAGTTDITAILEMGTIKLSAVDGKGGKLPALFILRDKETQAEMGRATSSSGDPVQISIPPGTYDIVASSLKSNLEPKPSVPVSGVVVTADKPVEQVIRFVLGTLKLRGRNAKEQPMQTQFTIYKAASDEIVTTAPASGDWIIFDLAPGTYDALGVNTSSSDKPQPMIWLRDMKVADGQTVSHEAIFTAGKLKIIGRGPNNQVIKCSFKVFQYGKDRELINGTTGQDWEVFEIQPGKYYLEAGYNDEEQSVMLKQWVNISVGENEVVEIVLR